MNLCTLHLFDVVFAAHDTTQLEGVRFPRLRCLVLRHCRGAEVLLDQLAVAGCPSLTHLMMMQSTARSALSVSLDRFLLSFSGLRGLEIALPKSRSSSGLPDIASICHHRDTLRRLQVLNEFKWGSKVYSVEDLAKLCRVYNNLECITISVPDIVHDDSSAGWRTENLERYVVSR